MWSASPRPEVVHFGIGEESDSPEPEIQVYRANLPANPEASKNALAESEIRFRQMNAALDDVPGRLDGLVSRTQQASAAPAGEAVSFSVSTYESEPALESELLADLAEADSAGVRGVVSDVVSFGMSEEFSGALAEAKSRLDALVEQVNREVLHFIWVETQVDGRLVGRTMIDWSGDAQTWWSAGVTDEQAALHQSTLRIAAQTRNLKLRLFSTVTSGAAKVAALMATPGGAVLALPAVFQYVMKIIAQVKELQSIS